MDKEEKYLQDNLERNIEDKAILCHALRDVARQEFTNFSLVENIAKRISQKQDLVNYYTEKLAENKKGGETR